MVSRAGSNRCPHCRQPASFWPANAAESLLALGVMASLPWLLAVHERFGSQTLQAVKNTCFWWYSMNSCEGGFEEGNVI